jgi:hypothetical protein
VEVVSGISMEDKIKVWNKTTPEKIGDSDDDNDSEVNED